MNKKEIRKILLNRIVHDYHNNKNKNQILKNLKNIGLLEKQLNGGGKDLKIEYNNKIYVFNKLDDPYTSIVAYVLYSIDKKDNCVVITIDKELHNATIDNLTSYGLKCSTNLILVKITIKLLMKYKEKLNVNKIILTDHSFIFCENIKKNIELADLYTLKYGDTFYGSLGFIPYNEDEEKQHKLIKKYKQNKNIIENLLAKDSKILEYLDKYSNKYKIDISKLKNYILVNKDIKLSKIIQLISSKKNFNNYCILLNYILPKLFKNNKLTSFYNNQFIILL
jgi:hypothetical protein